MNGRNPCCTIILLITLLIFAACGSSSPTTAPRPTATTAWYDGGTLHAATVAQWQKGSPADRLATTADWLVAISDIEDQGLDVVKSTAEEVITCVNETAEVSPAQMKASELALSCAILMGIVE